MPVITDQDIALKLSVRETLPRFGIFDDIRLVHDFRTVDGIYLEQFGPIQRIEFIGVIDDARLDYVAHVTLQQQNGDFTAVEMNLSTLLGFEQDRRHQLISAVDAIQGKGCGDAAAWSLYHWFRQAQEVEHMHLFWSPEMTIREWMHCRRIVQAKLLALPKKDRKQIKVRYPLLAYSIKKQHENDLVSVLNYFGITLQHEVAA